ncbi:hypothetical protein KPL70_021379 [Citrus sinensis]|nr:hypothetical protein KPL70_021379 [Citrus sinensis]
MGILSSNSDGDRDIRKISGMEQENLPIQAFNDQGFPIYPAKLHGHFLWGVPASGTCDAGCPCWEDIEEDDDEPKRRKRKSKKIIYLVCRYHAAHPKYPSEPDSQAPLPIYDKGLAWIRKHEPTLLNYRTQSTHETTHVSPTPEIQSYMMFSPLTSTEYQAQFPPLEKQTDQQKNLISKPYVPSAVTPAGHLEEPHSFEAILNWQTQNAVAQNQALTTLHHKVDNITHKTNQVEKKVDTISDKLNQIYQNLHNKVTQLDSELRAMLAQRVYSPDFDKNEAEIRALKAKIARIDSERVQPTLFTSFAPLPVINPTYHPFLPSFSSRTYEPSKLFDSLSIESSDLSDFDTSDSNLADISKLLMAEPTKQSGATDTGLRTEPIDTNDENHETSETGESSQSIPSQPKALAVLHDQFIGEPSATFEVARRDYLNMKCCSLNTKDLHYHYKRMFLLYYKLNGFNDPTLRHIALGCLEKLCEQKKFFQELIKDKEPFRSACKKPYLAIKCKDPKKCDCSPKKKSHFKKSRFPFPSRKWCTKQFCFFRKRQSHSKRLPDKKKSICFVCKKKGHFAKDCAVKPQKATKLIQYLESTTEFSPTTDQVEHLFSEQEEPNDDTVFVLPTDSSDSDSSDFEPIYTVQPSSILIHDRTIPIPSIKIQIIPSKYHKPITAIGFIDTGAQRSTHDEHHKLLQQLFQIIQEHGIMISDKKSTITTTAIDFLGMKIQDGHYQPRPHIAQELLHFPKNPYEDFTPVPSPSPYELGSSFSPYPPFSSQPNQPEHYPQPVPSSPQDIPLPKGKYCPWPCVPGCSHPERILKKDKDPDCDPDETESSSKDGTIAL